MKKLLFMALIFASANLFGQVKPINFDDCKTDIMFVSAEIQPQWNDSLSIPNYLNHYFDKHSFILNKDINGKIVLGIMIYDDGKTCCSTFFNLTKSQLNPEQFRKAVNEMHKWVPAKQNGKAIIFLKNQIVEIKDGSFSE